MVNTMGWNERSDPDMRTANFCDVYREGVYILGLFLKPRLLICLARVGNCATDMSTLCCMN